MELNLLRLDLDIKRKDQTINHIFERLSYFHDIGFLPIFAIESIVLIKKSSYGAYITLMKPLKNETNVVCFQALLGSDYRKETNTLINHHILEMQYSNRLFTTKRYKGGKIKTAKKYDITEIIKKKVLSNRRSKYFN